MKIRCGISCLAIAGSLVSTQAFADQVKALVDDDMYEDITTEIPIITVPSAADNGVAPEFVVKDDLAVPPDEGEQIATRTEPEDFIQTAAVDSSALEEERAQLEEERSELERERARLEEQQARLEEQQSEMESASGSQQVIWGEGQQASVQVPPPVTPEMVRELQQTLQAQGQDPGPIDGIWGPQTHQALTQYQEQQGLEGSGQLDNQTLSSLDLTEPAARQRASLEQ